MFKQIIFLFLIFVFYGCTYSKNELINKDFMLSKKTTTSNRCTLNSYVIKEDSQKYGKIFIEYINLNNDCNWNGFPRGYFVDLFMNSIKAKRYKLQERLDFKNIEISHYLIDDKYNVSIVYEYSISSDTFLIDYNGLYTNELIKKYDKNYINNFLNKKRLDVDYSESLVRFNSIKNYFTPKRMMFEN